MDHTPEITFLKQIRSALTLSVKDMKWSEVQTQIATVRQDITRRIIELQHPLSACAQKLAHVRDCGDPRCPWGQKYECDGTGTDCPPRAHDHKVLI